MIQCIAIDDEPLALVVIEEFCRSHGDIKLLKTFTNTKEAADFIRRFPVDLLFLDIQMPQNGLDFYRAHGAGRMVIFTTAHREYAVEGFNVDAIDYLLKPVDKIRFDTAVRRAVEHFQLSRKTPLKEAAIFVRSEYRLVKVELAEIVYIETMDDYLKIHVASGKPVLTKMNMKAMMEKLDPGEFMRIHRSYIVPMRKVSAVRGKHAEIGTVRLPVGESYEEAFMRRFRDNSF